MGKIPRVAVAGVGGFAAEHHRALMSLESEGVAKVVGTCDPDVGLAAAQAERFGFSERGVAVYPSVRALLDSEGPELDLLTLPIPIPLHADAHRMAVDAGVACYLEKPPSLWWPEFCGMREVEKRAVRATQIGFNFIGDPFRRKLKARIVSGEFGAVREVRLHAIWPRDAAYYARNNWAGRLQVGDHWVLDSCIGNALAHYVQNLLFWCGSGDVDSVATIGEVKSWLCRDHPIESFDTALVEALLSNGSRLRIGATHAEVGNHAQTETIVLDGACIVFDQWNELRIVRADASVESDRSEFTDQNALLGLNLANYLEYVGGQTMRPTTRLEDSESFVALCDLALVSSGAIHEFCGAAALAEFVETGKWPSDVPTSVTMDGLVQLAEVAKSSLI